MVTALAELDQTETETRPRFQGQQGYNAATRLEVAQATHRQAGMDGYIELQIEIKTAARLHVALCENYT